MTTWYYATADRQRHGPFTAEQIKALADDGSIVASTLLWREGDAGWQPLSVHAAALGLSGSAPPPLPGATAAHPAAPPPGQGLSGCAIFAIVGAIGGVVLLGVGGILAAIAVPAYNDYTQRSTMIYAIAEARVYQPHVVEFLQAHGRCPGNDDAGFRAAGDYGDETVHLSSVEFGDFEGSDQCGLEATVHAPGRSALHGDTIWLEYDPDTGAWECTSSVADKHLPMECRG